jgi:lysophospholipase
LTSAKTLDGIAGSLVATPDNPVPAGATIVPVATADGLVLRAARWDATGPRRRGTVTILQGRAEFIEKYFEVVGELRRRGFAVVAFDWRGQGGSGREVANPRKGYVRDFGDYRRDLEAIREQVLDPLMPAPRFALAHSMGGAITLGAAAEGWLPFERVVTSTPMVALFMVRRTRLARGSARLLNALGWGKSFIPGGSETSISTKPFAGNRLTGDPRRYARNAAAAAALGPGAIGDPTVAWVDAAYRHMAKLADPAAPSRIRTPTLVVAAGADPIVATPAIERFAARLKAGHAIVLPGARHEILMERDAIREDFWAAFDAFIPGTRTLIDSRSSVQDREGLLVQPSVAGGDD